ncbi:hypothetical protein QAD02_001375 [Eretmocerus hayati]|uniref:Uncharacterized protein n=1 Tax=Eretmocerus hayati TaxID=131215 RepID=A0ACC2NGB8_9HYME|nr:hypothetical protein QAD02_001375 [Eretmocerus hayati]
MTGGVRVMNIQGRMRTERERAIGMTEAERAWRAQWVKDQVLHDEPITPDAYYRERYNPIRRFYRAPLDKLENFLAPRLNPTKAAIIRHLIGKTAIGITFFYCAAYYFKYNPSTWETKGGWKITQSRIAMYPGDPGFPNFKNKEPHEYAAFGFEKSPI